jgi:uncharacterized protein YdeI (YjbR/CyaY-like superfamily)
METVKVKDRAGWRRWLQRHHATSTGVWLLVRKKRTDRPGVTYDEAVEEALCFGWIDGLPLPSTAPTTHISHISTISMMT